MQRYSFERHRLYGHSLFKLEFEPELPESVLSHKPLNMLIQCLDPRHVRLGFRGDAHEPWRLSKVYDVAEVLKDEIAELAMHCWSTTTGGMYQGQLGSPMYQKFLIDYVHYRYGLSAR